MNLGQAPRSRSAAGWARPADPLLLAALAAVMVAAATDAASAAEPLRVGAAAVEIPADDAMDMAGGILAWKATGAEAPLRATAVVLALGDRKLAVCSCDVLFVQRDFVDPALARIHAATGIAPDHILVHATHTHAAPSATRVHGYDRDERFVAGLTEAIVDAVVAADADLADHPDCRLRYRLGEESSVGQNSRLLLSDGTIFWTGDHADAVRPTGPFDTDLPVIVLETAAGAPIATIFNHATHTIGGREPGRRSPAFYGLAAQELEKEHGGVYVFLQGASGSTHNLTLGADEMVVRMKAAVARAGAAADMRTVPRLAATREAFHFRVRAFDEAEEEAAVTGYCSTRFQSPEAVASTAGVFRRQRAELAPHQGTTRTTWIHTLLVGDVAIVGVPAEFFTVLGQDIKRRSPFRHTIVAELAGDWIGYLPDREGHRLGGYQTWTGHHSYAEPGTGERVVAAALAQLERLHDTSRADATP